MVTPALVPENTMLDVPALSDMLVESSMLQQVPVPVIVTVLAPRFRDRVLLLLLLKVPVVSALPFVVSVPVDKNSVRVEPSVKASSNDTVAPAASIVRLMSSVLPAVVIV